MDEMITPAAAIREGPTQAAVTEEAGNPEAEVVPEGEAAGHLQRLGDQRGGGLAILELRAQPTQQVALRRARLNPNAAGARQAQRKEGQRRNNAQPAMRDLTLPDRLNRPDPTDRVPRLRTQPVLWLVRRLALAREPALPSRRLKGRQTCQIVRPNGATRLPTRRLSGTGGRKTIRADYRGFRQRVTPNGNRSRIGATARARRERFTAITGAPTATMSSIFETNGEPKSGMERNFSMLVSLMTIGGLGAAGFRS